MTLPDTLTAIGAALCVISYAVYIPGVIKGQLRPHLFTWTIFTILCAIGFGAQWNQSAGPGMWITALAGIFNGIIALLALKYGEKNIARSDWVCFIASLLAIPVWLLASTPLYAVIMISLIDVLAIYPTFRKSWMKPWDEKILSYFLVAVQFLLSVLAMNVLNVITTLYPLTIVVMNIGLITLLAARRKYVAKPVL